jgi:predicted transposase/invertase (TIGR01784 family)
MKKSNLQGKSKKNSHKVKRNHKASVFTSLFSDPDVLRELYSAIEGITIPHDIPVVINTLSGVLYPTQENDVSFLIDNRLVVLIEHQSTISENMPLRLLEYVEHIYEKTIDLEKKYQKNMIKIPRPEFIVLYNGLDDYSEYSELKLSDMFMDVEGLKQASIEKTPLELIVQVYNINHGHNPELLKKCKTLDNYSFFIDKIREYLNKKKTLEKAVKLAVKYCIKKNILKKYLQENSSEVFNMIFGEYDREMDIAVNRREAWEDGRAEGREEGREEGKIITAKNLLDEGSSLEFVYKVTGLSPAKIKKIK